MSRPSASVLLEAHPPALPMLAKTSRAPYSSSFMMTKSLPQPVSMRCVSPVRSCGREGRVVAMPTPGSESRFFLDWPTLSTCSSRLPSR